METPVMEVNQTAYDRIGGLLWLLAAILVLNPVRILYVIFTVSVPSYSTAPTGGLAAFEMAVSLVFLLYSLIVPYYFFTRRRKGPAMIIVLFLVNIVFVATNGTMTEWIPPAERHGAGQFRMVEFVAGSVWFLLWTLYLIGSKRVKGTFVR
jgi:hypothetical protein